MGLQELPQFQQQYGKEAASTISAVVGNVLSGAARSKETRSEEHTSELQSLMRISYAVFCLKKKQKKHNNKTDHQQREKQHMSTAIQTHDTNPINNNYIHT